MGLALANAEARQELAASRARIVEAGDAERRRLERNLHDGAQQRLVALSLGLRVCERKLAEGDEEAGDLLRRAREELADALAELRELARGIHPAILTDHGLVPALEMLADRADVPVEIAAPLAERLPQPVEAAAYYIVAEALTNASKHAQASHVRVGVRALRPQRAGRGGRRRGRGRGSAPRVRAARPARPRRGARRRARGREPARRRDDPDGPPALRLTPDEFSGVASPTARPSAGRATS